MKKAENVEATMTEKAREIWLAGLGVFSTIEEEGSKLFKTFVEKGEDLEKKGEGVEKRARKFSEEKRKEFGDKMDEFAQMWEDGMNTAFEKFGVASSHDLRSLSSKVDKLADKVDALTDKLGNGKAKSSKKAS